MRAVTRNIQFYCSGLRIRGMARAVVDVKIVRMRITETAAILP